MKNLKLLFFVIIVFLAAVCCQAQKSHSPKTVTIPKEEYEALKHAQSNKHYIVLPRQEYDSLVREKERLQLEAKLLYLRLLPSIPSGGMDTSKVNKSPR